MRIPGTTRRPIAVSIQRFGFDHEQLPGIEARMRPGSGIASRAGFLGQNESLVQILQKDEATLIQWIGSRNPADLQKAYRTIADLLETVSRTLSSKTIRINGATFCIQPTLWLGSQACPYDDNFSVSRDIAVVNATTGKTLRFSELMPHLINKHRFFEGEGTPYRVSPESIIEFFGLKPHQEPRIEIVESTGQLRYGSQINLIEEFLKLYTNDPNAALLQMRNMINKGNLNDLPLEALDRFYAEIERISRIDYTSDLFETLEIFSRLEAELIISLGVFVAWPRNPLTIYILADTPGYRYAEFSRGDAQGMSDYGNGSVLI